LGRDSDNDIVVPAEAISRRHASFERRGDACLIKDLGSTNGIMVGGRRVAERLLAPGDHASIGRGVTLQYLGSVDFAAELVAATVRDAVSAADRAPAGRAGGIPSREARLGRTVEGAVLAIGHVMRSRDPYTAKHERRVAELAAAIACEMSLEGEDLAAVRLAALIHDIGKMSVPAEILAKPGRLNEAELDLIRQHVRAGYDIIESIEFGPPVAEMVLQHHERADGSGYPRGLVGPQILLEARILAVADVAEAMSSHRPYRAALGTEAALAELKTHAGARYDVDIVAACVRLFNDGGFALTP
jgi:putative nucleotidyltransferase with HDIG domain